LKERDLKIEIDRMKLENKKLKEETLDRMKGFEEYK
jgi:hypothetical protein